MLMLGFSAEPPGLPSHSLALANRVLFCFAVLYGLAWLAAANGFAGFWWQQWPGQVLFCSAEQPATSFSFRCSDGCSKEIDSFTAMAIDHFVGHGSIIDSLVH